MGLFNGLMKRRWLIVAVAWSFHAAFAQEPGREGAAPPAPGMANPQPADQDRQASPLTVCLLVESAAQAHGLPLEFFARLIFQESRFNPGALGPATGKGQRAQGIAQFMPDTAKQRGVLDPFDPVAALPKSAEFLRELRNQFGNLGLAAAAYNAGPKRVRKWLAGRSRLPEQTRNYVSAVTGRSAEAWRRGEGPVLTPDNRISCSDLMALLKAEPTQFADELEQRVRHSAEMAWGVELSAGFDRERVLAAYANLEKCYRAILADRDPIIIESKLRTRGTQPFYQVRVGADTRASAQDLCSALRSAGAVCMVLHNPAISPQSL